MIKYLLQRGVYYLSIFFGIILFSFVLFHIIPSDPARTVLGPNAEQAQVERLREKLGLDKPLYMQFALYLKSLSKFNFGRSFVDDRNVFQEVLKRLLITLALIGIATVIHVIYLALVMVGFLVPGFRRFSDLSDFLMSSLPVFFSGILFAILTLYYYPVTSFSGKITSVEDILYLIPPALVLSFYPMAILSGILKQEMSEVLKAPFVRAEQSWGFSNVKIVMVYAFRNSLIPLLSAFSNILPAMFTGAFIVEVIFSIPGIGSLLVKSILEQDFPMLECTVILNGVFFALTNLLFEAAYPIVDPRILKGDKE